MSEMISVKDKLPKVGQKCLFMDYDGYFYVGYAEAINLFRDQDEEMLYSISHWMPLPEIKEKETEFPKGLRGIEELKRQLRAVNSMWRGEPIDNCSYEMTVIEYLNIIRRLDEIEETLDEVVENLQHVISHLGLDQLGNG